MLRRNEFGAARTGSLERPDLRKQYRPIGIGAVAAALSVNGEQETRESDGNGARKGGQRRVDTLAA